MQNDPRDFDRDDLAGKAERFSGLEVGCLKASARRSSCRS
jgi:hypothetical protein